MSALASRITFDWPKGFAALEPFLFQTPDIIFAVDTSCRCLFFNQGGVSFLKGDPENFLEKPIELIGALGSILESNFQKLFETKEAFRIEHELSGLENAKHFVEAEYRLVVGPVGQNLGALVILRDITEKKSQEASARDLVRRFEAQNRALNVFDIIAETDRRGQITYVNDKFVEISKYSREELLGQDHRILNSKNHPKTFFKEMWTTIAQGNVWTGEIRNRAKDGSHYWVSTVITPIIDDSGAIEGFLAVRREITKQKQVEEALRESESRYRELLNNVNLVAVGLNLQGRITFANDALCRLLGKAKEELLGLDWFTNFVPRSLQQKLMDLHSNILVNEKSHREHEAEIITPQGEQRTISWRDSVFRNSVGDLIGVTSIGEDVTERRKNEKQVMELQAKSERQREEIVAFVSHELRSPLTSAKMGLNQLVKDLDPNSETFEILTRTSQQIERIERLSRDLMESAISAGRELRYQPETVHLNKFVSKICERMQEELKTKSNLTLEFENPSVEMVGLWDPSRLDQVFTNLISNAIKYSKPEGGKISVSLAKDPTAVHITVADSGVGIPAENLGNIFEIFSRAENVRNSNVGGFGLGLKISKDIVEKHHGKIWAESELGKGSKFHVLLPFHSNT